MSVLFRSRDDNSGGIYNLAVSQDALCLATCSKDRSINVYDVCNRCAFRAVLLLFYQLWWSSSSCCVEPSIQLTAFISRLSLLNSFSDAHEDVVKGSRFSTLECLLSCLRSCLSQASVLYRRVAAAYSRVAAKTRSARALLLVAMVAAHMPQQAVKVWDCRQRDAVMQLRDWHTNVINTIKCVHLQTPRLLSNTMFQVSSLPARAYYDVWYRPDSQGDCC